MPCVIDMLTIRCYSSCIVVDLELSDSESELSLSDTDGSSTDSEDITDHDDGEGLEDDGFTSDLSDVKIRDFNQHTGPTILNLEFTELDYFNQIFPQEAIDLIVSATNHYAAQRHLMKPDPNWTDTSPAEIKAYIGLNILFGIVALPSIKDYWSTNEYLGKRNIQIFIFES